MSYQYRTERDGHHFENKILLSLDTDYLWVSSIFLNVNSRLLSITLASSPDSHSIFSWLLSGLLLVLLLLPPVLSNFSTSTTPHTPMMLKILSTLPEENVYLSYYISILTRYHPTDSSKKYINGKSTPD